MPTQEPYKPRATVPEPRRGEPIRAEQIASLVQYARDRSVPSIRGGHEDQDRLTTRRLQHARDELSYFPCDSDVADVDEFSIFEVYDADLSDSGIILKVRQATSAIHALYAGNENYQIKGGRGWVKLITTYEPVVVNGADGQSIQFLQSLDPTGAYTVSATEEDSRLLAAASLSSEGRVPVLAKVDADIDTQTDGGGACPCNDCLEGTDMPASSTVCCNTHLHWTFTDPWLGGEKDLKWTSGNVWLTDEFSGPACIPTLSTTAATTSGGPATANNQYKWRLTVSDTVGSTLLELVMETNNGCPEACIQYVTTTPWMCKCPNQLVRKYWDNVPSSETLCVVCLTPVTDGGFFLEGTGNLPCAGGCPTGVDGIELPRSVRLAMTGATGWVQNAPAGSPYVMLVNHTLNNSSGDLVADVDVNGTTYCTIQPADDPDANAGCLGAVRDSAGFFFCNAVWQDNVISGVTGDAYDPGFPEWANRCILTHRQVSLVRVHPCKWALTVEITAPAAAFSTTGSLVLAGAGPVQARWQVISPDFTGQTAQDFVDWVNGTHNLPFLNMTISGSTIPGGRTFTSGGGTIEFPATVEVAIGASASGGDLDDAGPGPSADGACAGCSTPAAPTDDPGACCMGGVCFDISQTDCTTFSGVWYSTDAACEGDCELGPDYACCKGDGTDTGCECVNTGASSCQALISDSEFGGCGTDFGWHPYMTCDEVGCSTQPTTSGGTTTTTTIASTS